MYSNFGGDGDQQVEAARSRDLTPSFSYWLRSSICILLYSHESHHHRWNRCSDSSIKTRSCGYLTSSKDLTRGPEYWTSYRGTGRLMRDPTRKRRGIYTSWLHPLCILSGLPGGVRSEVNLTLTRWSPLVHHGRSVWLMCRELVFICTDGRLVICTWTGWRNGMPLVEGLSGAIFGDGEEGGDEFRKMGRVGRIWGWSRGGGGGTL